MLNFFLTKKVVVKFILFYTFFTNYLSQKGFCAPSVGSSTVSSKVSFDLEIGSVPVLDGHACGPTTLISLASTTRYMGTKLHLQSFDPTYHLILTHDDGRINRIQGHLRNLDQRAYWTLVLLVRRPRSRTSASLRSRSNVNHLRDRDTLGARASVPSGYTASTLQGNG